MIETWEDFRALSLPEQKRYVMTMRRAGYNDTKIAARLGEPACRIEYWKRANGMQQKKTCPDLHLTKQQTLCWDCKKALGGCSWSRRFEPVPGWKAVVSETAGYLNEAMRQIPSYCVLNCPEFIEG